MWFFNTYIVRPYFFRETFFEIVENLRVNRLPKHWSQQKIAIFFCKVVLADVESPSPGIRPKKKIQNDIRRKSRKNPSIHRGCLNPLHVRFTWFILSFPAHRVWMESHWKRRRPFEIVPDLAKSIRFFLAIRSAKTRSPQSPLFCGLKKSYRRFFVENTGGCCFDLWDIAEYIELESFMSWNYFPPSSVVVS